MSWYYIKQWCSVLKKAHESVDKIKQTHVILSTINSSAVAVCLGFSTNMINDFGYKKRWCIFLNEFRWVRDGFFP